MQFLFILITLTTGFYVICAKRCFDFFSLGFFSALLYFSPGFFGYVLVPTPKLGYEYFQDQILDETYTIMTLVMAGIFIGALYFDYYICPKTLNFSHTESKEKILIILLVTIAGFLLSLVSWIKAGKPMMTEYGKGDVIKTLGQFYILLQLGSTSLSVISFSCRNWALFRLSIFFILIDLYIGNRETIVFSIVSLLFTGLLFQGRQRLMRYWLQGILVLPLIFIPFLYKGLYRAIQAGNWELVYDRLTHTEYYIESLTYSEPFFTQGILNNIISNDFKSGLGPLYSLSNQFILYSNKLGFDNISFSEILKPALYPFKQNGLASNVWGEMWSMGGWILLIGFIFLYILIVFYGSYLVTSKKSENNVFFRSFLIIFMMVWTFYIHRSGLGYNINVLKRVLIVFTMCEITFIFMPLKSTWRNLNQAIQSRHK
jgi:hypothetical protein